MPRQPTAPEYLPNARAGGQTFAMGGAPLRSNVGNIKDAEPYPWREQWHYEAFLYSKACGPVDYTMRAKSDLLSRCLIRPEVRVPNSDDWVPTEDPRVQRVLRAFVDKNGSQGALLAKASKLAEKTGRAWLYGTPHIDRRTGRVGKFTWDFLSTSELQVERRGKVMLMSWGRGVKDKQAPPDGLAYDCLFYPDDEYSDRSTSPIFNILPQLKQWVLCSQVIDAIARSQLNAQMLFIPHEVSMGPPDEYEDPGNPSTGMDEVEEQLHDHTGRSVEDNSSPTRLNPLMLRGPALIKDGGGSAVKTIDTMGLVVIGRELDTYLQAIRQELLLTMAWSLDCPPEVMMGTGSSNHWCVDDQTEILTRSGWKHHGELREGDTTLTLNHETGVSEWQPVDRVNRFDVVDEEMLSIEGRFHSSLTTKSHRWPVLNTPGTTVVEDGVRRSVRLPDQKVWRTSEQLRTNDRLISAAPNADIPVEPKWSDALVELVGWFWTEGSCEVRDGRNHPRITISQSHVKNPYNTSRIRYALGRLFGPCSPSLGKGGRFPDPDTPPMWAEQTASNGMTIFRLNTVATKELTAIAPNRVVSLDFIRQLTTAQLDLFMDVSIKADGHYMGGKTPVIGQKDKERLEPLELAAILSGFSTNLVPRSNHDAPHHDGNNWILTWRPRTTVTLQKNKPQPSRYTGIVWCPTTGNRSWFARRNGKTFYTGNSAWQTDDEFIVRDVVPLGNRVLDKVTAKYLRPMLVLTGMTEDEAEWFRFRLDPTPVTANPDSSAVATTAHEALVVSDEAWIENLGLDVGDIATDDEKARRMMEKIAMAFPSTAPSAMPFAFPGVDFGKTFDSWVVSRNEKTDPVPLPTEEVPGPDGPPVQQQSHRLSLAGPVVMQTLSHAANRELLEALAVGGCRLTAMTDGETKAKLRKTHKHTVLAVGGAKLAKSVGVTNDELFAGVFDPLNSRVAEWLTEDQCGRGVELSVARGKAQVAADELCSQLVLLAASSLTGSLRRGVNGLLVPDRVILSALQAGDLLESSPA